MYVCICNNVTEKDIENAVNAGASTVGCLKQELGVSSCCGQCEERASGFLKTMLPNQPANATIFGTVSAQPA